MKIAFRSMLFGMMLAFGSAATAQQPDLDATMERLKQQWKVVGPQVTRNHLIFQRLAARNWIIEFKSLGTSDSLSLNCAPFFTGLPKVSQDGSNFYFILSVPADNSRYVIALERNRAPRVIAKLPQAASFFDVSPNQTEMVYQQRMEGSGYKIFQKTLLHVSQTEPTEVTDPKVGGLLPSYSPDGTSIAYVSQRKLRVRALETGEERILVDDPLLKELPTWSPDSQEIAYQAVSPDGYDYDIYKVEVTTGKVTRLIASAGLDVNPVFTADGQSILFTSDRVHGNRLPTICIMDRNGQNVQHDATAGCPIYLPGVSRTATLTYGPHLQPAPDRKIAQPAAPVATQVAGSQATPTSSAPVGALQQQSTIVHVPVQNTVSYKYEDLLAALGAKKTDIEQVLDGRHLFYLARATTGVQVLAHNPEIGRHVLLAELPHSSLAAPDVSADRSALTFKFVDQAARTTHLIKLERGQSPQSLVTLPLTPDLAFESFDISDDESFFVFDVRVEEGFTIYRHDIEPGKTSPLLPPAEGGIHPSLSPDNKKMAYVSGGAIKVIDITEPSQTPTRVVQDDSLKYYPSWVGQDNIIYQGTMGEVGGFDIFLASLSEPADSGTRLTKAAGDDMMPVIHGPSGRIIFVSDRENAGYPELFTMLPDGSSQQHQPLVGADLHFPR